MYPVPGESSTEISTSSSTPFTTSSQASKTSSITPSITPLVTPSVIPSITPPDTPSSLPTTLSSVIKTPSISSAPPTKTPPKVSNSDKPANTSPKYVASSGSSNAPYPPSAGASGGTTTRMALPTFTASSGMMLPSITQAASLNSSNSSSSTACGQCSVMAEQVQVFYWPTASLKKDCARASSITPFASGPTYAANVTTNATKSINALGGDGSVEVIDGFTYTFPSMYISVVGKISVSNSCGVIGATHTNPTPVPVQAITTASYASWPSTCRGQGDYVNVVVDTLDAADIACPTWGLSDPFYTTCDGDVYLTATEGAPYNPVILVPTQFLSYDPAWDVCTKVQSNGPFILPCGVYDPPKALHTASLMAPIVTPAADPPSDPHATAIPVVTASPNLAQPTATPVQAPQTVKAQVPRPVQSSGNGLTGDPNQAASQQHGPINNAPAADPNPAPSQGQESPNNAPAADPKQAASQGQESPNRAPAADPNQAASQGQGIPKNAPVDPNQGSASNGPPQESNNHPAGSQAAPVAADPQKAAPAPQPIPQTTINIGGTQPSPAIGGIIHSAFAGGPAQPGVARGGSNQGSGTGGNPGGTQGGSPASNAASGSGNSAGGASSGGPGGSSEGTPAGSSGGTSGTGSSGVSQGASAGAAGGNVGGSFGDTSGSAGGAAGSGSGASPNGNAGGGSENGQANSGDGSQGGNRQPNVPPFTPHAVTVLGQTLSAINPSAVVIAGQTLSAGGPAFSSNGNFYSVGPTGNLVAGTLAPGPVPAPVLTLAGSAYTANSASQFVIAGQTLNPGAKITVSGTPISLAPGSSNVAVVGSSTQALSMITPAPAQAPAVLTVAGSTFTANSASQFVVAGQTLNPGQQITVSGIPISLASSGVSNNFAVVGGNTQSLQSVATVAPQAPALLTFDGSTYTANSASGYVIGGKTLTPGGLITVSGVPISEGSRGLFAVIGTSTQPLQAPSMTAAPALLTFDGETYTANSASGFVIAGQFLTPGGVITVSGTPISEAAAGSGLIAIGSSTQVLAHVAAMTTDPAVMTFNGQTYTANAESSFVINGQTLTPGGIITVSGTPVSEAASGGGLVVVGSSTQVLGHASPAVTQAAVMTFNGQSFTANAASGFVIDGQTLTPGGIITVSGTPISEAAGATDVVIGSSTEVLGTATISPSAMTFVGGQMKRSVPGLAWLVGWLGLSMCSGMLILT